MGIVRNFPCLDFLACKNVSIFHTLYRVFLYTLLRYILMTWKLPPWHIIYSISRRIFLLRYLIFGMGMIYIFWCVEKFMKTLQICQSFCNCIRNVYPCVTWLFYSRSLNNMIFEKYNSQVYFDAGTLYFLVLQCIHHFHSFMNSNVSRYTRHSTIHWNAPNVSKFIVAFQRTPLNKSYIQTICISTFYIRGVGVYDANMNFNEIFYIQGHQTSQCTQSLHVFLT